MKIGVIGAGNWGTALANLLAGKGIDVVLWAYETDVVTNINNKHKNHLYLQGVTLSRDLAATNNLAEAVRDKDMILSLQPSAFSLQPYITSTLASMFTKKTFY